MLNRFFLYSLAYLNDFYSSHAYKYLYIIYTTHHLLHTHILFQRFFVLTIVIFYRICKYTYPPSIFVLHCTLVNRLQLLRRCTLIKTNNNVSM